MTDYLNVVGLWLCSIILAAITNILKKSIEDKITTLFGHYGKTIKLANYGRRRKLISRAHFLRKNISLYIEAWFVYITLLIFFVGNMIVPILTISLIRLDPSAKLALLQSYIKLKLGLTINIEELAINIVSCGFFVFSAILAFQLLIRLEVVLLVNRQIKRASIRDLTLRRNKLKGTKL